MHFTQLRKMIIMHDFHTAKQSEANHDIETYRQYTINQFKIVSVGKMSMFLKYVKLHSWYTGRFGSHFEGQVYCECTVLLYFNLSYITKILTFDFNNFNSINLQSEINYVNIFREACFSYKGRRWKWYEISDLRFPFIFICRFFFYYPLK